MNSVPPTQENCQVITCTPPLLIWYKPILVHLSLRLSSQSFFFSFSFHFGSSFTLTSRSVWFFASLTLGHTHPWTGWFTLHRHRHGQTHSTHTQCPCTCVHTHKLINWHCVNFQAWLAVWLSMNQAAVTVPCLSVALWAEPLKRK